MIGRPDSVALGPVVISQGNALRTFHQGAARPFSLEAAPAADPFRRCRALAQANNGAPALFVTTNAADERFPRAIDVVAPPRVAQMSGAFPGRSHQVPRVRPARRTGNFARSKRLALPIARKTWVDRGADLVLKEGRIQLGPSLIIRQHDEPDARGGDAGHTLTVGGDGSAATARSGSSPNTSARESSMMIIVGRSLSTG